MLLLAMLMSGGLLIFPRALLMLLFLALSLVYLKSSSIYPKRRNLYISLWLTILAIITIVRPEGSGMASLLPRISNFLVAIVLLNVYASRPGNAISSDLHTLLKPMAFQSILTSAIAAIAPWAFVSITMGDVEYRSFLFLLNYHNTIEGASLFVRPDGYFFEPGVFQFYLNIFLLLTIMRNGSWKAIALASIAVLCTQSTTGLIIEALLLSGYAASKLARASAKRKLALIPIVVLMAIPAAMVVYENINNKIFGELQGSAAAREYDLLVGLNLIQDNPLIGIGFDHDNYRNKAGDLGLDSDALGSDDQEGRSTSNGLVNLFYSVGIPLGSIIILGFFRQPFFSKRIAFGMLITISLLGESLTFTPFFLMFAFSGLMLRKPPQKTEQAAPCSQPSVS